MSDGTTPAITAILTVYKRPNTLSLQIQCLREQTIPPKEIWVWKNQNTDMSYNLPSDIKCVESNHNFKYYSRFAFAQLVTTPYIAIIDDDMFPQKKWLEHCLYYIEKYNGVMGGLGVKLLADNYTSNIKFGWSDRREDFIQEVDICCQSWFFKKEWLKYLWITEPLTWENGEDILFSFSLKKYGEIKSYIPPHPEHDKSVWSSNFEQGYPYSTDHNATWRTNKEHFITRNMLCSYYIYKYGWPLCRYNLT